MPDTDGSPSASRWAQVRALLERALELSEGERAPFVAREAGSDSALRAEVLALLDGEQLPPLEPPEGLRPADEPDAELRPRLGPWRLLRRIGTGGMGSVFLGVRADGQFKRRVAIKLIKRGMDTEDVLRRFERERQVLAGLDHPGIARLLDCGMSTDGRPYLVLEFVEGEPIDRWCDGQRLGLRERLELFAQVCDAVDDAHKSLVVHRDIKPSNVLVDAEGRPKLLDFGIAKVLDPARGFATVDLTGTPLRLLTPAYASPEQVRGGAITTASDVYSLGALLYELLAGRRPFDLTGSSPLEIERTVCERDPPAPGAVLAAAPDAQAVAALRNTSPRALRRGLAGDLDTIVLKALRKEPRRRYASAAELAADVRAHLRGLPVGARPDTFGYRASRFARRNRLAVASAGAVLLALVAGLGISLWQFSRARSANAELAGQTAAAENSRALAEARALELQQLAADLQARSAEAEAARMDAEQQRALAQRRYEDGREVATSLIFAVHKALAKVPGTLEAKEILVRNGLGFLDGLAAEGDRDPLLRRELVGGYLRFAEIQASASGTTGRSGEALASVDKALAIAEELHAERPDDPSCDFSLGSALLQHGGLLAMRGRGSEAKASYGRARDVCAEGIAIQAKPGLRYVRGVALARLAELQLQRGRMDEAAQALGEGLAEIEDLTQTMPGLGTTLAESLNLLSTLRRAQGDPAGAQDALERAIAVLEDMVRDQPLNELAQRGARENRLSLGRLLLERDDPGGARELADLVLDEVDELLRSTPQDREARRTRARALHLAASAREPAGDLEAMEQLALRAVGESRGLSAEDPADATVHHDLGRALALAARAQHARDRSLEADELLRDALDVFGELARRDPATSMGLPARAAVHLQQGDMYGDLASEASADQAPAWLRRSREAYATGLEELARWSEHADLGPFERGSKEGLTSGLARTSDALERLAAR